MPAAPAGAEVRLYYDAFFTKVAPGDALVTTTGRTYLVVAARRQLRGKHWGRFHLQCVVVDHGAPIGVTVHPLFWHPRGRARGDRHNSVIEPLRKIKVSGAAG